MKQEIAKLLIDVAKYLITAVILSSMLSDKTSDYTYLMAGGLIVVCLLGAYLLFYRKDNSNKKKGK